MHTYFDKLYTTAIVIKNLFICITLEIIKLVTMSMPNFYFKNSKSFSIFLIHFFHFFKLSN